MLGKVLMGAIPVAVGSSLLCLSKEDSPVSLFRSAKNFAKPPSSSSHGPEYNDGFNKLFPRGEWNENWDFRAPEELLKKDKKYSAADEETRQQMLKDSKPTAIRNIFLIRHGQYHMDKPDKNLTPLGREQAAILGERLAVSGIVFDKLIKSTMCRATETANIILEKMPELKHSSCSLIEEGAPYPPVPSNSDWKPDVWQFYTDGARIEASFRKYFHRADVKQKTDSNELIVCHANVIRYFVCRALQLPPEAWLRMSLGNCSITWIQIRPTGRVSAKAIGDTGHLPASKVSYT